MPKRSSLAEKINGQICPVPDIRYPDHLITGPKKCPKSDHSNTGRFGIRMLTVHICLGCLEALLLASP
jgi:hypothetical protein